MKRSPILIIGIGNESRGDDALGVLLLRRLASQPWQACEFIETYQLQIEQALDLEGRACVLFIDAGTETPAPYSLESIQPLHERPVFTHALTPQALLGIKLSLDQHTPQAHVLCICGESFDLGAPLTAFASTNLAQAESEAMRFLTLAETTHNHVDSDNNQEYDGRILER